MPLSKHTSRANTTIESSAAEHCGVLKREKLFFFFHGFDDLFFARFSI